MTDTISDEARELLLAILARLGVTDCQINSVGLFEQEIGAVLAAARQEGAREMRERILSLTTLINEPEFVGWLRENPTEAQKFQEAFRNGLIAYELAYQDAIRALPLGR